jgi:hypothetical protein
MKWMKRRIAYALACAVLGAIVLAYYRGEDEQAQYIIDNALPWKIWRWLS